MTRTKIAAALILAACCAVGAAPSAAALAPAEETWITLGADLFERARVAFAPLPAWSDAVVLERLDEHDGVVLTRIPPEAIDRLAELVHTELRSCGGFVRHASREAAEAAMARRRGPRAGFFALPFAIEQPALASALVADVDEANILATITALSTLFPNRYHGHHATHHSADWIRDQWLALAAGRPDVTVEFFEHPGRTPQPSVILTIPGSTLPDEIVVLGGHQDSIRGGCSISSNPNCVAPGADDDASGLASLTEALRVAFAHDFRPQRTIQVMAYAAEEVGLVGSDHIAQTYWNQGRDVVAVFQLDMTAYEGPTHEIDLTADWTDPELNDSVIDLIETYLPGITHGGTPCGYACSDHAPWHDLGFRTTYPFEAGDDDYNPWIHTQNDTVATFGNSAAHAAKFARLAAAFLVEAGIDGPEAPSMPFLDGFETADTSRWSATID